LEISASCDWGNSFFPPVKLTNVLVPIVPFTPDEPRDGSRSVVQSVAGPCPVVVIDASDVELATPAFDGVR
jgi:hypothetical protein